MVRKTNATMANRIGRELTQLTQDPPPGVAAWLIDDSDTSKLRAQLEGPEDTPYFGGIFHVSLTLPSQYPFRPPDARFLTRIYHPNIDASGRICLDILKMPPQGGWKPSINLATLLTSLRLLLSEPNGNDPLLVDVAKELKQTPDVFYSKAKSWTERYADPQKTPSPNSEEENDVLEENRTPDSPDTVTQDAPAQPKPSILPRRRLGLFRRKLQNPSPSPASITTPTTSSSSSPSSLPIPPSSDPPFNPTPLALAQSKLKPSIIKSPNRRLGLSSRPRKGPIPPSSSGHPSSSSSSSSFSSSSSSVPRQEVPIPSSPTRKERPSSSLEIPKPLNSPISTSINLDEDEGKSEDEDEGKDEDEDEGKGEGQDQGEDQGEGEGKRRAPEEASSSRKRSRRSPSHTNTHPPEESSQEQALPPIIPEESSASLVQWPEASPEEKVDPPRRKPRTRRTRRKSKEKAEIPPSAEDEVMCKSRKRSRQRQEEQSNPNEDGDDEDKDGVLVQVPSENPSKEMEVRVEMEKGNPLASSSSPSSMGPLDSAPTSYPLDKPPSPISSATSIPLSPNDQHDHSPQSSGRESDSSKLQETTLSPTDPSLSPKRKRIAKPNTPSAQTSRPPRPTARNPMDKTQKGLLGHPRLVIPLMMFPSEPTQSPALPKVSGSRVGLLRGKRR